MNLPLIRNSQVPVKVQFQVAKQFGNRVLDGILKKKSCGNCETAIAAFNARLDFPEFKCIGKDCIGQ